MAPEDHAILRGQVWAVDFGVEIGRKWALVVSTNARNRTRWPEVHVVRLTTSPPKTRLPATVELPAGEPFVGWARCDNVLPLSKEHLLSQDGAVSPGVMRQVEDALMWVFAIVR